MTIVRNAVLSIKSPAFVNSEFIPAQYACNGAGISPALLIEEIPLETVSLALVVEDPDAPNGTYDHWVMWNIPVKNKIEENTAPGTQGKNSNGENKYMGPCPPSGQSHRYHFKIYALDAKLDLPESAGKKELLKAMENHIIGTGQLTGLYKK
jgi:Raf kinase inhibitor-like YbhB/YbcL family protein